MYEVRYVLWVTYGVLYYVIDMMLLTVQLLVHQLQSSVPWAAARPPVTSSGSCTPGIVTDLKIHMLASDSWLVRAQGSFTCHSSSEEHWSSSSGGYAYHARYEHAWVNFTVSKGSRQPVVVSDCSIDVTSDATSPSGGSVKVGQPRSVCFGGDLLLLLSLSSST